MNKMKTFKREDNDAIVEIENDRVLQRTLIGEFRVWLILEIKSKFAVRISQSEEAAPSEAMLKRRTFLSRASGCLEAELMLENWLHDELQVSFQASAADDVRVNGQWRYDGKHEGRDAFCRTIDRDVVIQWRSRTKEWHLRLRNEEDYLYRLSDQEQKTDLPTSGWEPASGTGKAPVMEKCSAFDFFEVFDSSWEMHPPTFSGNAMPTKDSHWCQVQGPYGESILSWLWHLQNHDHHHPQIVAAYKSITMGILTREPELAGRVMNKEPYLGETILHQACAAGDVEMVDWIVNNPTIREQDFFAVDLLDGHMGGSFLNDILKIPERLSSVVNLTKVPDSEASLNGCTPLCVAMMAPHNDDDSIAIVRLLLRAGAKTIYYDSKTEKIRYTIFHFIAASSWWEGWEQSPVLSKTRISMLLSIFLDPHAEFHHLGHEMVSLPNLNNYTPIHVCAMFGNEDCFIELLDRMKVPVWEWGRKREVGFPLRELDSGARDEDIAALELMTLYKHGNLLTLGIMATIIDKKWNLFGNRWAQRFVAMQIIGCICTALVCLDDTDGYSGLRYTSKCIVMALSGSFLLASLLLWIFCARDECWFKHMDMSLLGSDSDDRISLWDQICFRNVVEMLYMLIIVVTPPWYTNDVLRKHSTYNFIWHTLASAWFLMFITFSLRYFELWRNTAAMASTLPEVIFRDMLPFGSFYFVILICSAISMRISVETQAEDADHAFGSFKNTLWTMEEAIHGPDVQWRNAVEHHPMVAGAIFVGFLWITLVMMSILIAMFGTTWEDLKEHVNERFLFRRAMFCITLEKLFPQSYHSHPSWGPAGCNIGHPLGSSAPDFDESSESESDVDEEAGEQQPLVRGPRSPTRKSEAERKAEEEQKIKKLNDRWLLWNGGTTTFPKWRKETKHAERQHL